MIVLIPDHCLSIYFFHSKEKKERKESNNIITSKTSYRGTPFSIFLAGYSARTSYHLIFLIT